MATEVEIDDSLYSRQRYVLGDGAMQRMAKSNVLLCGLGGLGVEIAKNIILAGVKSLTIQDSEPATYHDLGTQFFLREDDVQKETNRAEASAGRLAELNPYVSVKVLTAPINDQTDLSVLKDFQCVILTESSLETQLKVDEFCRDNNIKFISADVYGVFCSAFCDFGDQFEVIDTNGEEAKDCFVANITKANPGVVTCLENRMHGFESGDSVTFKEVKGMSAINGTTCKINVLSPYAFTICDTTGEQFAAYEDGGIATQVKIPQVMNFESLEKQIKHPSYLTADLSKFEVPPNIHVGLIALHQFRHKHKQLPNVRCDKDADELIKLACDVNNELSNKVEPLDENLIRCLSYTSRGCLAPLCAALGGIVAQEALKSITGKFTPLQQWLFLDASEVTPVSDIAVDSFQPRQSRYDCLRTCIGEELMKKLAEFKLFMVGCGAIGCEMLKNYALLGVGRTEQGKITITDNDLIEKSNLNRQFLFRPHHIRQPKSTTAAQSVKDINCELNIEAQQHKVGPQTENTIYTDKFFESQDLMVNALDNVEARRYMDGRCLTNQRGLLESGTMGAKGHVQVIVPHMTESYSSQRDPPDEDVPYCTLKSFPAAIEHCIQWARDKFESSFAQKPAMFSKFWSTHTNTDELIQRLDSCLPVEGAVTASKLASGRPYDWVACVALARVKFEKYFTNRAKHLIHIFPLDTKLQDGSLFWQSPKRPPIPIQFDPANELHMLFVTSTARLYADITGVKWSTDDMSGDNIKKILQSVKVPEYKPSKKKIVTDETAAKPEDSEEMGEDELKLSARRIQSACKESHIDGAFKPMSPLSFEKDDDSNGHIDFITAASNLRAAMYRIEEADRLKTKRIAGRIVPAIATTTAAVAGLVTIEMLKYVKKAPLDHYKNCFLNLALPIMLFSEPGPCEKSVIREGLSYTIWDKWEVHGNKDFTLQQFLQYFKEKYGFEATMVVHGVKMVYVPIMPGHKKRLPQTMLKLIKQTTDKKYVDLVVSFEGESDDVPGPPVRYYFGL